MRTFILGRPWTAKHWLLTGALGAALILVLAWSARSIDLSAGELVRAPVHARPDLAHGAAELGLPAEAGAAGVRNHPAGGMGTLLAIVLALPLCFSARAT